MSSIRSATPSVRNAIRNTKITGPGPSQQARGMKNRPPGPTGDSYSGHSHGPSGNIPWVLGAAAVAVPAGVWISNISSGRDRPHEVSFDSAVDRLKATKHRDFENLSDRGSQIGHDGKATLNYMGNELLGRAGEHPHFKQERLNNERERLSNERFRPSVNERTGEHIHPERKSSWNLFDSLRGSARKETEDLKRTTGDISHATERRAEDTMRATGDTVRSAENRAGDALRTAENKMGETWRATEGKGEEALRTAEEKSRSFFDSFRNRAGESYDYVKDKAGNTEQTLYDAFNKPQDLPEHVQQDIERQKHSVWRRNPDSRTAHPAGDPHSSHSNIEHNTPHGGPYGRAGRHPRNFAESVEGPPEDSPNKAPTVPSSDEHKITNAAHRRLYAKDAANFYPEKSKKGEGVLETARLTQPVNSWTRPLRGAGSQHEPPKHD